MDESDSIDSLVLVTAYTLSPRNGPMRCDALAPALDNERDGILRNLKTLTYSGGHGAPIY
ncbi:hypothetical protein A3852_23115 [Rhodococcus qingshengii]|nr:hypothetical protein A3852_23115 [Rhodococcus qingshengii]